MTESESDSAEGDGAQDSYESNPIPEPRQKIVLEREKRTTFFDVLFCFMNESKG